MAEPSSVNQPSSEISIVTSPQTGTEFTTRPSSTNAALPAQTSSSAPKSRSNAAAIIAPVVILSLLVIAVAAFFLVRRRRRKQNAGYAIADRSLHRSQPSGSEVNPLLVTPLAWPQPTPSNGRIVDSGLGGGHSRRPSDGTPLMQPTLGINHDLEASESDTYTSSPRRTRDILPLDPNRAVPLTRAETMEAVLSPESTYSQSSASTRVEQEINGEALSSARWTLPPLPQIEPLTDEILQTRGAHGNNAVASSSRNPFSRTPSRSRSRGNSIRPRTVLPNAPMSPLIEDRIAPHTIINPVPNGAERWSSAADPGGAHPRPADSTSYTQLPGSQPYRSQPPTPTQSPAGFGFGFGMLTSAFRKSLSASSIASDTTNLHHAYPTHTNLLTANNTNASLRHFSSADSLGRSSGTGSSASAGGTYYSAVSMSEFGETRAKGAGTGTGGTSRDRNNIPAALRPRSRAPSSRNSLSTFPSIPSLPSFSVRSATSPVPPVPTLPASAPSSASRDVQFLAGPSGQQNPAASPLPLLEAPLPPIPPPKRQRSSTDPTIKAHLRPPAAQRVGARAGLARAGPSTHGIIDIVQR